MAALGNEPLVELVHKLYEQNRNVANARHQYLMKEAQRKHYEATAISASLGKSHAEKVTLAQSTKGWLDFHRELAKLESIYQFELFKFEIMKLEYQSIYLLTKQDGDLVGKQGTS